MNYQNVSNVRAKNVYESSGIIDFVKFSFYMSWIIYI